MSTSSQNLIHFETRCHRENIWVLQLNIAEKKIWGKNCGKKFWQKNVGKINYKTKIFITKIYSNIDKCHTIFALLAPFDKTGRKTGRNVNVCGIWFKIASGAHSHRTQGMWRFERNREKRYITACELSVTRLPHERYLLHRWYEILVPGLPLRWSAEHLVPRKSQALYISCFLVVRYWIVTVNTPALILGTFREPD